MQRVDNTLQKYEAEIKERTGQVNCCCLLSFCAYMHACMSMSASVHATLESPVGSVSHRVLGQFPSVNQPHQSSGKPASAEGHPVPVDLCY